MGIQLRFLTRTGRGYFGRSFITMWLRRGVEYEELGPRGFDFNLLGEEREGCVGDDVKDLPYF